MRTVRRVVRVSANITTVDSSTPILVSDTGNDQTLLTTAWRVIHDTGREVIMTGAFAGRNVGEVFPVVSAVAKLIGEDGVQHVVIAHEALYDSNPAQTESLLSVHQSLRDRQNGIDDRARCEMDLHGKPGLQAARFGTTVIPFFFDGTKCFFEVVPVTDAELQSVTSPVVITDGTVPYEPMARLHSRRRPVTDTVTVAQWKQRLGFAPDHVIKKTMDATTQLVTTVEAETREVMRDHFQTRLPELKVRRVNDTCYVDTFFASVPSIRGYDCWNLFAYQRSGMDVVYLLRKRSQSPATLSSLITDFGAPARIKSDNAPEFKGKKWTAILQRYAIQQAFTEAHHPNENLAERRGGALKAATVHLMTRTKTPLEYWCFALEYVCLLRSVLARRSLEWISPHERFWGERPDISVFRFVFYQPIWYYDPRQSFPNPRMLPGRFLGIAQNVGDAFCFLVLTEPSTTDIGDNRQRTVLARSVIRSRDDTVPNDTVPRTPVQLDTVVFLTNDGNTVLQDPPPYPEEDSDARDDVVQQNDSTTPLALELGGDADPETALRNGLEDISRPRHSTLTNQSNASVSDDLHTIREASSLTHTTTQPLETLTPNDIITTDHDTVEEESTPLRSKRPRMNTTELNQRGNLIPGGGYQDTIYDNAAITTAGDHGDDRGYDSPGNPSDGVNGPRQITQDDDDLDPPIYDSILRQLDRIAEDSLDDDNFDSVVKHEWVKGELHFKVLWKTGEHSMIPFSLVQRDYPKEVAKYIIDNKVGSDGGKHTGGRYTRWARQYQRQYNRIVRRVIDTASGTVRMSNNTSDDGTDEIVDPLLYDSMRLIRRNTTTTVQGRAMGTPNRGSKRRKPGRISRPVQVKYGVQVPRNVKHAFELDSEEGHTHWADAIKKEVSSLLDLECFEFFPPEYKPSSEYQLTKLTMIFEVKQDGRRKARLVAGGHLVDPMGINPRSTVVKGISVRLLDLIAHRDGLRTLCGDIGNAFITAKCMEKIYARAGPEFGEREGAILIFRKALYGLRSSSRAFRAHFADFLRSMGFKASRYDRDVWLRERESKHGYDYICTHVDDFKIVARNPDRWSQLISKEFLLKSIGPPKYYLGNDYNYSETEKAWVVSCATYVKECVRRVESDSDLNITPLYTHRTPLPDNCHPELDDSDLLKDSGIRKYQMLIGMAQWACTIGRLDIAFAVSSLSRFSTAPRTNHLGMALHLFGYLKKHPNRRIVMDSRPMQIDEELLKNSFHPDFLEDYPDASEDIAPDLPKPYGSELHTTVFFDADHAHDHVTRRSISGLLVFVGSTPVIWHSKRQGCIATSTYCAEFVAMRGAVEEAISIRYMLRCLGVPVTKPTNMFGDNFGVIQSAEIPEGELKKKHIAISYHYVREAITAKIVNANWCRTDENFADVLTKALGATIFNDLVSEVMA